MQSILMEVPEEEATGKLWNIYEDIKDTLRVPMVNLIYRHMAIYPEYLEKAWGELRPNLRSASVWQAAARIKEEANLNINRRISENVLGVVGVGTHELEQIRETLNFYNEVNPKGLMAITALLSALEGKSVEKPHQTQGRPSEASIYDQAPSHSLLPMAKLDEVSPQVFALLQEMSQPLAIGGKETVIPSLFRHFVSWPGFLGLLLVALKPTIGSQEFIERAKLLQELARQEVARWPYPVTVGLKLLEASDYPLAAADNLINTWKQFIPIIAKMIVLGDTIDRTLPL